MAIFYGTEGLSYRMGRCCARSHHRKTWSAGLVPYGDIAGCDIRDHCRNEKRRHPFRAFRQDLLRLPHDSLKTTYTGAYIYAEPERIYIASLTGIES